MEETHLQGLIHHLERKLETRWTKLGLLKRGHKVRAKRWGKQRTKLRLD